VRGGEEWVRGERARLVLLLPVKRMRWVAAKKEEAPRMVTDSKPWGCSNMPVLWESD
jgi:hypothetical protein